MRKSLSALLLIIVTVCLLGGCEKRRDDFYQKAVEYYNKGMITEAGLEIKNALSIDPECAPCRLLFGKIALENGNFQGAFVNFRYASDLAPASVEAKVELSKLYLLAREYDDAGDTARKALNLDASNIEARLVLASVLAESRKFSEAQKMLEIALNEDPGNPDVYLSMSSVFIRQGNMEKAEDALLDGLKRLPQNTSLLMKVVAFYRKNDDPDTALKYVEKLLQSSDADPRTKVFAAEFYSTMGNDTKAAELMAEVVHNHPEEAEYRVLYSRVLNSQKKFVETEKVLKEGLTYQASSLAVRSSLAGLYMAQGRQEEAIRVLLDGVALDPEGTESSDYVVYRKQLATMYLDMNEPNKAIEQLDSVIELNPKDAEAHYLRGQIYLLEGRGNLAVSEFRQVVRDNPESAPAYVLLARAHLVNGETNIAIENLKEAINLEPGYAPAREVLINTYLDRKDWHQAILELQRLREKRPDDIQILAAIGDVYSIKGDKNLASRTYNELSEKFPDSPVGEMKLAELARSLGKNSLAEMHYTAALKVAPDSLAAIQGKVDIFILQHKYTAATNFCERLLQKFPDNARIYELLGKVHAAWGNFEDAETNYSRAVTLAPEWMLPYMRIGDLYVSNKKLKQGIAKFKEEIKKNGESPGPQFLLGLLYEQNGEYEKSREVYSKLLEQHPGFQLAANNLAYLLATRFSDNGEYMDQALRLARVAASSQSPEALDTLGYVLYLNGEYKQALHVFNSALQLLPDFSAAQYHKALVYSREGKNDEAKKILNSLLKSKEDFPERKDALNLLGRL
ncbi:tetratricopeptide repeat protein [Maridesulfovibrio salexigens]|uniref:Tetratricopeptide TPR_2 repeat protein n=1 Tax=Maridesulfovibrio salexigens (strain ATCC 14822 / DSM 2638 / NCIMB 8403 / VKM B-1763) TaxID=526222 RepID=C6BXH8_MARSD|nr:tetratricopeptide repeat protein [Maridesulfovibrio salexigens]ACS80484.1 Tetratricopeptide TPR_2 repeat protein [Maridesulfovibrio salexigens DSM 2638]